MEEAQKISLSENAMAANSDNCDISDLTGALRWGAVLLQCLFKQGIVLKLTALSWPTLDTFEIWEQDLKKTTKNSEIVI